MKFDLDFDEMNFEIDNAMSVDMPLLDFGLAIEMRKALFPNVRKAFGNTGIEENPEFRKRLKDLYDAIIDSYQRLQALVTPRLQKFTNLVKKAVLTFSAHSRVRAHRSPVRSRSRVAARDNDEGDSDGSGDPDPPLSAKRSYHLTFSKPKFQENSFALTVVSPRQSQHGLSFFKKGRAV